MREDSFKYKFDKGLRTHEDVPRNSGMLEECHGMRVYAGHLTTLATMTPVDLTQQSLFATETDSLQLFCLRDANYLCQDGHIWTLDTNLDTIHHKIVSGITTFWSVADFGPYVVFSNGTNNYTTDPTTGVISLYSGIDIPICGILCNYKGQLIGGNPVGYDSNVVLWGAIGWANMDLNDSRVAGYMPMPWQGAVYNLMRLGEHVAVYGRDGVALLATTDTVPPGFGLREVITSHGLISQQAVAGNLYHQLFIRSDGMLCLLEAERNRPIVYKFTELGYQEFLKDLTTVKISFDDGLKEWYIASDTTCFIYTEGGLSTIDKKVATCQAYRGQLWGVSETVVNNGAYVKTTELDMGARADKAIEYVELASDGSWNISVDWRRTTSASFVASPTFPINPMGAGRAKVSGVDFKIKLTSTSASAQLDQMTIRWKYQDKRFVRGLNASQTSARTD